MTSSWTVLEIYCSYHKITTTMSRMNHTISKFADNKSTCPPNQLYSITGSSLAAVNPNNNIRYQSFNRPPTTALIKTLIYLQIACNTCIRHFDRYSQKWKVEQFDIVILVVVNFVIITKIDYTPTLPVRNPGFCEYKLWQYNDCWWIVSLRIQITHGHTISYVYLVRPCLSLCCI